MDGDDCIVCTSSSGESLADNADDSFIEELFEEDGECEIILVPRRDKPVCVEINDKHVHEDVLGGVGYSEIFLSCVTSLEGEELVVRSPRGQRLKVLLDALRTLEQQKVAGVAISLIVTVNDCLESGRGCKLPSAVQASVWSAFHQLRSSQGLKDSWNTFISVNVPKSQQKEPELALQLILDRILRQLLKNKANAKKSSAASAEATSVRPLTAMESNAVRYMAGYVAVKLLKRYSKSSKNTQLQSKRRMFVRVLREMRAVDQPGEPASILEYTTEWSEIIDRGGLYHISDEVIYIHMFG